MPISPHPDDHLGELVAYDVGHTRCLGELIAYHSGDLWSVRFLTGPPEIKGQTELVDCSQLSWQSEVPTYDRGNSGGATPRTTPANARNDEAGPLAFW